MSKKRLLSRAEVDVDVWEERDRLHIIIRDKKTGQRTIAEWWDDDARQMFEDGFFKRGVELKRSVINYAEEIGLISMLGRNPGVRKNIFTFNNPGNAQRVLAENFVKGANSGVASSMYIHGNRIYSYGPHFPIAERHTISTTPLAGTPVIIITNRKSPSKTTAGQIGLVKAAAQAAGMEIMYEELKPEAKGPAAYSNPRGVRRNIFTFNNPHGGKQLECCKKLGPGGSCVNCGKHTHFDVEWLLPSRAGDDHRTACSSRCALQIKKKPMSNPRELNMVESAAAAVGLVVGTWAPGDGVTRYRFFVKSGASRYGDYNQGDGLYTALGRKDAMAFIAAYGKGRSARKNPKSSGSMYVIEGFTHQGRRGQSKRYGAFRTPSFEKARARAEQIFQETGSVVAITQKNPLTRSEAGYLLRHARADVREAGSARRYGLVGEQKYHTGRARGIGFAVQETGPKAARRAWVTMHTTLDRVLRNPPPCPNPVVRGDKLPPHLKAEVLRKFIYRWTTENQKRESSWSGISGKPRIPLISDAQWLREHAFHVTKDGRLSLKHHHAEPYYMADDWKKGDPLPNPLLQTIGLVANPPLAATWDRLTGRQREALLEVVGYDRDYSVGMVRSSWSTLSPSAKRKLEAGWLDTSYRSTGETTRRRYAPVGANPLTRTESGQVLRDARFDVRHGSTFQAGHTRSSRAGMAFAKAKVVRQYGPKSARRAADRISDKARKVARTTISNPGGLRLPAPGTKMTVAQAMELARRIGNKDLIRQCQQAARLQKTSDRNTKCVVWKTLPLGSANKIDTVVAMTHYGDSPEDMYRPPTGSKKGAHMYRHKWKRSVPVLASPSGKAIIKVMGPGQKVGDWMRG